MITPNRFNTFVHAAVHSEFVVNWLKKANGIPKSNTNLFFIYLHQIKKKKGKQTYK